MKPSELLDEESQWIQNGVLQCISKIFVLPIFAVGKDVLSAQEHNLISGTCYYDSPFNYQEQTSRSNCPSITVFLSPVAESISAQPSYRLQMGLSQIYCCSLLLLQT